MAAIRAEGEEQRQQRAAELEAARAERGELSRQHQSELAGARAEREEQNRQHESEVAALQEQTRRMRSLLIGIATGATVISIAAVIVAIIMWLGKP